MNAISKIEESVGCGLPAYDVADLITSRLIGRDLRDALHRHFPDVSRDVVYEAIGLAMSMNEVDLMLAEAGRDDALRRLAELEGRAHG
jgi:hypothetical protein